MKILAIESSCDETAAAVVGDGAEILSNVVVSQIDIFAAYGGVIPEVAARSHLEVILPVMHKALADAGCTRDEIDYIAVTYAPGLLGSLLIGTLTARTLAILWQKPLYAVHHLKSHIYSNWLLDSSSLRTTSLEPVSTPSPYPKYGDASGDAISRSSSRKDKQASLSLDSSGWTVRSSALPRISSKMTSSKDAEGSSKLIVSDEEAPEFPLLALVISGGHTQIIYMSQHNHFEIIGTTRDDAVGECFDKVAKILGLPYPGGPSIAKCAEQGDAEKYQLPHPKVDGLDFSFSGLKTAVLRAVQADCGLPITTPSYELAGHLSEQQKADFAASFQRAACEILLEKVRLALVRHPEVKSVVLAGGVSANQVLREKTMEGFRDESVKVYFPDPKYTGDNAAMVGAAAYYEIMAGVEPTDPYQLNILPRTPIK